MKVLIDTNVLISGIFFSGPPFEILKAWRDGSIDIILSSEIADEYIRVSKILASRFPLVNVDRILFLVITYSNIVEAQPLSHQVCEDQDDDKFLSCAIASGCKVIISGDKHLLRTSGYQGIAIVTPRVFIQQYLKK